MNNLMAYKGYRGTVHYSGEDRVLFGKVAFIRALISYESTDVVSLARSFHKGVDDYLNLCQHQGQPPAKPFKGTFG